jgi:hypothetical protein
MGTVLKLAGGLAVVFVSFLATLWALDTFGSGCPAGERFELKRPFAVVNGRAFLSSQPALTILSDTTTSPTRSPLLLCEGNIALGPPHTQHADIVAKGAGRFSHWGPDVIFSSSDGADPNTNGQTYVAVKPR